MVSKTPGSPAGNASQPPPLPSVRRIRRRLTRWSEPRSGKATKSVSSPAIDPATSGQRARSRAAAMAWADPGSVRMINRRPASWNSTGRSAMSLRRRSSPDVSASINRGGSAYAAVPSRVTLIRPSSATSREMVAWVVRKPRSRRAAASSCWVRIGRCSTRSRMARWRSCFMTSMAALCGPDAGRDQQQDGPREDEAIDHEDVEGVGPHVVEEHPDREQPGQERRDQADEERRDADVDPRLAADELPELQQRGPGGHRRGHQEAEAGGGRPVQPGEPAGRDRDARRADAGDQRDRLRDADPERERERDIVDLLRRGPEAVGQPQDDAADDERDRDDPGGADRLLEDVVEEEPGDGGRDRGRDEQPRELAVRIALERAVADGRQTGGDEPGPVRREVDQERPERTHVEHHAERERVDERVGPAEEPGHQDQVPRRRD